jgi:methylglutaconyl-CoA hydratase
MPAPLALLTVDDPQIALLTLNRPEKRNALSVELIQAATAAVIEAAREPARRVLVVRGAGPAFCAGLDLVQAADARNSEASAHALCELYLAITASPLVSVAAVQGAAMGGGAGLMAACDLTVAAEDLRIGFPEVRRGLVAALVTCLFRRQLGDRTLRELTLLGQNIDASRATSLGLVQRVVARSALDAAALEMAMQICQGAPGAIARTKQLLDDLSARPIAEELKRAMGYHLSARNSAEAAEGTAAFREKRPPHWGARPTNEPH